jgi:hypothetical protein
MVATKFTKLIAVIIIIVILILWTNAASGKPKAPILPESGSGRPTLVIEDGRMDQPIDFLGWQIIPTFANGSSGDNMLGVNQARRSYPTSKTNSLLL